MGGRDRHPAVVWVVIYGVMHAIAASDIVMTRNSAIADKPRDAFLQNVACKYAPRYYPAKNVRYKSNGMSVIAEIRLKNLTPRLPLSRSFKVIGTDADRSAILNDFLVTFHSNHGPTCHYRFWDKKRFQSKVPNLSHPRAFTAPA